MLMLSLDEAMRLSRCGENPDHHTEPDRVIFGRGAAL